MVSSVFNGDGNLMIVHSGGNVGIGTVQPIAKTVVENTGAIDSLRINDITADSSPFLIDQNGNVGIGTSTVGDSKFSVTADAVTDSLAAMTDQKVGWIKEGAGDRFDDLELQIRIAIVLAVVGCRHERR